MEALANGGDFGQLSKSDEEPFEGNLRATGQSTIEKTPQAPEIQELVACLSEGTERAGYRGPVSAWDSRCLFRLHIKP